MDVPNMQSSRQASSNSSGIRNNNNNVINSSFTSRSSRTDSSRSSGSGGGGSGAPNNNNRRNSSGRITKNNRSSRSMVGIEAAQLDVPHLDDDDMTHASSSVAAASSADAAAGYPPSLSGASFASGSHRSVSSRSSGRSSNKKRNSKTKKETSSKSRSAIIIEDEETTSSSYYYNENNIEWGSVSSRTELSDSLNKQQQFDTVNISGNKNRYQATFHNTTSNNDPSSRSRMVTSRSSLDQTLTTIDYNSSSAKSLNLEMPTSSNETNQSRRSSLIFESLWEGTSNLWNSSRSLFATNGNQNDDASHHHHNQQGGVKFGTKHTHNLRSNRYNYEDEGADDDSSFAPTVASLNSNEESSSKHMQLMRTISGRVAFMRNPSCRIANNSVSDDDSLQGYGMGYNRCTRYTKYIMEHVKFTLLCLIISMAMAVSIGTLIVMIPLWINEDERDVSGELGGLVYAGDGEVTDISVTDGMKDAKGSLIMSDGSGNNADEQKLEDEAETGDWELGAEAQDLSSSSNNSNHGGGWTNEEKVPVLPSLDIGISSSSSLSSSSSIRPPTKTFFKPPPYELQDVCSSLSIADPDRYGECVAACLPSRCCLVPETEPYEVWTIPPSWDTIIMNTEDTIEDKVTIGTIIASCFLQHTDLCVTYNHECSILDISVLLPRKPPTDEEVSKMNNSEKLKLAEWVNHSCGKLHTTRSSSEESECKLLCQEKECCFVDDPSSKESSTTTPEETNPTEDAGPNPSFLRHHYIRVIAENNDPEMVYMGIPGEEGFEYAAPKEEEELTSPPEETNQTVITTKEEMAVVPNEQPPMKEETIEIGAQNVVSTFTKVQEKENEIIENCVSDPEMFCLTYTGCGPLFDAN